MTNSPKRRKKRVAGLPVMDKQQAQDRINRIAAFREELHALETEGVLKLDPEQKERIESYHGALIDDYERAFDVDVTSQERKFSLWIRIAAYFGGLTLSLAIIFFFLRIWGYLPNVLRFLVLAMATCVSVLVTDLVSRKGVRAYLVVIFSFLSLTLFCVNIFMLGKVFNFPFSPNAFLAISVFGILMAYFYCSRLVLFFSLCFLLCFLSARFGTFSGCYWVTFGERPENFLLGGALIWSGTLLPERWFGREMSSSYRIVGALTLFISLLILSNWGGASYIDGDADVIERYYQIVAFALWLGLIAYGIYCSSSAYTNMGIVFFSINLYTKVFDWWWEVMPKYQFFLFLALLFILTLIVIDRCRRIVKGRKARV